MELCCGIKEADPKLYPGMYLGLWELPFGRNKILP